MPLANDHGYAVENGIVGQNLERKSAQFISVALDFKSEKMPVENRDVCPEGAMTQPKLIDNKGAAVIVIPPESFRVKTLPDFGVLQRFS